MTSLTIKTSLFPYQCDAVEKLRHLCIGALYMEMGTGKTRTALELVKIRHDAGKINAVLWLCPCSVKQNLKYDIMYHCGEKPDWIVIRGIESIAGSDTLYLKLLNFVKKNRVYLIVDESNMVKNPFAKRTQRITELSRHCKYKMILNGTPVSRNEADMFAQWYILDWRILGYKSYYSFSANHLVYRTVKLPDGREVTTNQIVNVLDVDYLTERIKPFSYQIRKADCIKLPSKNYHMCTYKMTNEQYDIYMEVKDVYLFNVEDFRSDTIYQYFSALQHVTSGMNVVSYPTEKMRTKPIFKDWSENPRVIELKDTLIDAIDGEQVIIFTKYKHEVEDIEVMMDTYGISYAEFTGRLPQKKRQQSLQRFRDGDAQVLISNKMCGAYGLNLQFCSNIIFYNNDFDFATRSQSEDRVHRIGQTQEVHIYDIVAVDAIDTFICDNLDSKCSLVESFKKYLDKSRENRNKQNKKILK